MADGGEQNGAKTLWILLSFAILGLSLVLAVFSVVLRQIDCAEESYSTCSAVADPQMLLAVGGVIPAVLMLVDSIRKHGRPTRWMLVVVVVYVLWGGLLTRVA